MGRKWTTKDQEEFLTGWGPRYKQASEKKNYMFFWDDLFSAWFIAFPEAVAADVVNIAPELWSPEQQETAQKGILQRKAQLRDWFRNHMRPDCRVDSPGYIRKLVKLHEQKNTGKRSRKATEMYSARFYQGSDTQKTVQKRLRDEAPRDSAGELIQETKAEKSSRRMKIYGAEIMAAWKGATEEQTSEVLVALDESRMRRMSEEDNDPMPDDQQEGLRRLPRLMDVAAKEMHDVSGWYFTILSGGRGAAGVVQTASFHLGQTRNGVDFEHAYSDFNEVVMKPWTSFVRNLCGESGAQVPASERSTLEHVPNQGSVGPPSPSSRSPIPRPPIPQEGLVGNGHRTPQMAQPEGGTDGTARTPTPTPPSGDGSENVSPRHSEGEVAQAEPQASNSPPPENAPSSTSGGREDGPVRAEPQLPHSSSPPPARSPPPENTNDRRRSPSHDATVEHNTTLRASQGLRPDSWLQQALKRLRATEGPDWREAVDLWEGIERNQLEKAQPEGTKQRFSTVNRPLRSHDAQYEQELLTWWAYLQPEWRTSTDPLPLPLYHTPEGQNWSVLKVTGSNGLLIVMMAFAWWGKAVGLSPLWLTATADLKHTLKALANLCEETGSVPRRSTIKERRGAGTNIGKENSTLAGRRRKQAEAAPLARVSSKRRKQADPPTVPPTRVTRSSAVCASNSRR
ncbi:hypothetical protein PTI98_002320 [Pleurotus ostreatus]|nr:hypothetical protein PTI98_002320 [Pleurotus ostreatus]